MAHFYLYNIVACTSNTEIGMIALVGAGGGKYYPLGCLYFNPGGYKFCQGAQGGQAVSSTCSLADVLYPGSNRDRLYSHNDLVNLIETYSSQTMDSTESFGKYYRCFCKISYFLKSENRISDDEISIQFMSGFNFAFRKKIDAQLRAETPTHHPDDPYELSRIYSAAVFILSCKFYDEKIGINSIQETSDSKKRTSYFSTDTCI